MIEACWQGIVASNPTPPKSPSGVPEWCAIVEYLDGLGDT